MSFMFSSKLIKKILKERVLTGRYLINRNPSFLKGKSPFEMFHGRASYIKIFGCLTFCS